jgi:integrase
VQLALHKLLGSNRGPRTCNAARQAIIQWEKWLQKTGRISRTVLQNLKRFNQNADVRRKRRPLSQMEVDWLLATTAGAVDRAKSCGISPSSRARMYAVGICTGFRRGALLSLTRQSFFVSDETPQPFVRLAARFNKNRRHRDQPIPLGLAQECREWLKAQVQEGLLWRPLPHADLALRFRRDMEAARTGWINEATTAAERRQRESSNTLKYVYWDGTQNIWADFHSLRHTAITFAVRGVGLRAAQEWADHSTPVLTANYSEVDPQEVVKAAQSLPNILALSRRAKQNARSA